MNASSNTASVLAQSIPVFSADDFLIVDGANIDDSLSFAAEATLDDVYEFGQHAERKRLSLLAQTDGTYVIGQDTQTGEPNARVIVDSCLTVMNTQGVTLELLLLVELDEEELVANLHVLPLAPLTPTAQYRLVGIEIGNAARKLAQVACVSFSRGTKITMSSGAQKSIEELKVGDKVLTRDDGGQEIRWIGQNTVRAVGDFAPIVIKAGALNNTNDLIVSPDHRLFIYQRRDALGAGRSEVLVKARHLVNDDTVTQQDGGFIEYFQLLFDQHEIIYAEGIAAETLLVDTRTRPALTDNVSEEVLETLNGHSGWLHQEFEVGADLLGPDAAEKLRKASKR
ncbi:Hint domain-containing protein [Planktotalea sp.]|uniref:Hint domain-containing protein n=1 Tax=Planktotalea sp. TaxID=2029877 RepID=UPI003297BAC5